MGNSLCLCRALSIYEFKSDRLLGIGLITPPVGAVLFVGAAIGKVTIENTVKALLPFYAALFMVLMAVTYIPAISLWLPSVVL